MEWQFSSTTAKVSISSPRPGVSPAGFTLIEVVVAIGIFAVTVAAVLALLGLVARLPDEISDHDRAVRLADSIRAELVRLCDRTSVSETESRLDVFAGLIPPAGSASPLHLVASTDGTRVVRESEADVPATGIVLRDRYFLIEVCQQPPPLNYTAGAGFLAVTLTVKWPYQVPLGPGPTDAAAADMRQASAVVFSSALRP